MLESIKNIDDSEVEEYKKQIVIDDFVKLDDSLALYLREIIRYPLLTAEEELSLTTKYKETKDNDIRMQIANANLRLVVNIAKHYRVSGVPMLDIIQEGNLGLMRAIEMFEPDKGFKLSTYATWWIKQAILRYISNSSRLIRIPVHANETLLKYNKFVEAWKLEHLDEQLPDLDIIAEHLSVSVDVLRACILTAEPTSLDAPVLADEDQESVLGDFLADNVDISGEAEYNALKITIEDVLDDLSNRERDIIIKRFGLFGEREHTLEEVGQIYGLTRERIRQIESRGLKKLRHPKRKALLKDYLGE